jgi:hypothetical protein
MKTLPSRANFRAYIFSLTMILYLAGVLTPRAQAQTLPAYAVSQENNNLMTIDPLTGQTLTNVSITLAGETLSGARGLSKNPLNGKLYAILDLESETNTTGRALVTIDPTTGVATLIGNTGDFFAGITFATNGTLFGITGTNAKVKSTLYSINTTTGAATLLKAFPNDCQDEGESISFNLVDGFIYHSSGFSNDGCQVFEKINTTTLAETAIPLTGDPVNEVNALAYWTGNFFLYSDFNNLYLVTSTGQVHLLPGDADLFPSYKGIVFAGTAAPCSPLATLYGAANSGPHSPSYLYSIDPASATAALIGPTGFDAIGGIAFNSGGTLFGAGERADGTNTSVLLTINPCTGTGTEIGPTLIEDEDFATIEDISFRKSDGTLFAFMTNGTGTDALATLNTSTGAHAIIHNYESEADNGLAFSTAGTLFNANGPNLVTLNTTNGAMTSVAALSYPGSITENSPTVNAMDFQPGTGVLFGSVRTSVLAFRPPHSPIVAGIPQIPRQQFLATINTTTGSVTLVGPGQTQVGLDAIAFSAAVAALPPATITATGGTPQSTRVGTAFALPLQATVKDSSSTPVAGATVTFTVPGSGASATFAGGANTAVTNASGVAASVILTANATVGGPYNVAATVAGVATPANFALTNTVGPPAQIAITSGTPQTTTVTTAFALPLAVTVKDANGNVTPGVTVTFAAPGSGASGTFANGVNTAVTNASGVATSGTFTANATSGGPYNVTASLPSTGSPEFMAATALPNGFATQASFSLKNVDFAVAATTTTQTVKAGTTANYSLNFTAIVGNSVNATTFTCTGLPALSACTFTPASLPANSPNTPFTLAISTTAAKGNGGVGPANKFVGPAARLVKPLVFASLALLTLMLSIFAIPKRRFARLRISTIGVFGFAALLLAVSYISGCGGVGTGFPLGNNSPGTPAGTSTVTIVGTSGTVQRTTTVTLVVQ